MSHDILITNNYNNIVKNLDPEFTDHLNNNLTIEQNSAAINNGDFQITQNNNLTTDINNITRNNPPDIGAYEYED